MESTVLASDWSSAVPVIVFGVSCWGLVTGIGKMMKLRTEDDWKTYLANWFEMFGSFGAAAVGIAAFIVYAQENDGPWARVFTTTLAPLGLALAAGLTIGFIQRPRKTPKSEETVSPSASVIDGQPGSTDGAVG